MEALQHIEELFHYTGEIFLLFIGIYVFFKVSKLPGVLLVFYSINSLMLMLSFHNWFGLGFIAETLTSTTEQYGKLTPTIGAVCLGIISGVSRVSLAVGVFLLVRKAYVNKANAI